VKICKIVIKLISASLVKKQKQPTQFYNTYIFSLASSERKESSLVSDSDKGGGDDRAGSG